MKKPVTALFAVLLLAMGGVWCLRPPWAVGEDFQVQLVREMDTKPVRLDAGKVVLRPSFPYDDTTRQETFFLDMYISARYEPEPSVPGCVCHATMLSGTVSLNAEGEEMRLMERDAVRFAADQPYCFTNMTHSAARILLCYRYLK